ncbi:MAG TPA: TetR/AcrR family transcriptional regulator [Kofleriaceae bacterium]|nr:TetR/AcrR family transcriptional regulator [Kofleriaceae bacterium]
MTKGERTRKKLIDATGDLLRRQGFHATGLSDIVAESGAPRGSLYFYFPGGKDELSRAALEAAGASWRARIGAAVAGARDLDAAIASIVTLLADDLEASKFEHGCPVAAVALETTSEPVRKAIVAHYAEWERAIAAYLVMSGMAAGAAQRFAVVALSAIEGALLLARVRKSRLPLVTVGAALRAMV